MPVTITHSTPADGTFSATGAAAWDATHTVSGLGTMAEQNSSNVSITGGSITGVTGVLSSLTVNSTPTSGGAAGQIMFDTGSVLQESSNLVWDNTNKKLTITGATVTTSQPVLDMTQTWNAGAVTFTGLKFNATDTASAAASLLMDLQVNGVPKFSFQKTTILKIFTSTYNANTFLNLGQNNNSGTIAFSSNALGQHYALIGDTSGSGGAAQLKFGAQGSLAWNVNNRSDTGSPDLFLTRRGAANLRLGAADAAAPVAQTLSVQSVVAGTTNTAGANFTITGSQGTGTGAGGSIIFQVAPAGSSGTSQNALSTALIINSDRTISATAGTNAAITYGAQGLTSGFTIVDSTFTGIISSGQYALYVSRGIAGSIRTRGDGSFAWGTTNATDAADLILSRRGAANLRLGAADAAAPVAQTLSVQSVVAGTSNTAGANLTITGSQGTGTGAGGDIIFQTALAGSSGTAQNSLITALRIYSNQTVAVGKAYTVATLPAAGTQGRRAWVTDATAPTFLGALIGGGAVVCPVFDDGTAWVAG